MTERTGTSRINVKMLIVLGLVFCVVATGLVVGHTIRKRVIAQRALVAGKAAFASGDWEKASRELRTYLSKFPKDTPILRQYAQAQLSIRPARPDAIGAAIQAYRMMLRSDSADKDPKDLCERLARLYFAIGDYVEVRNIANQRLVMDSSDVSAMTWKARSYLAQQNFDEVLDTQPAKFVSFVEKNPTALPLYAILSDAALMSGRPTGPTMAQGWLDKAVQNNPKSAEALARRAVFYLSPGANKVPNRVAKARADLDAAEALNPDDADEHFLLAESWLELGSQVKEKELVSLSRARVQAHVSAAKKLPLAPNALFVFEKDEAAFSLLKTSARLALLQGDKEQSLALAKQAKDLPDPARQQFLPIATQMYLLNDMKAEARACLDEYHDFVKHKAQASKALTEQIALLDAQVANAEGHSYTALAKLEEVVKTGDAQDIMVWREMGYGYIRTHQDRRAAEALEKYTSARRDDFSALGDLAKLYYRNADWAKALQYAQGAIALDPEDLATNLIEIEATLKKAKGVEPGRAEREVLAGRLKMLRQSHPKSVEVRLLQALMAAQDNEWKTAEQRLREAMKECDSPLPATLQLIEIVNSQKKSDEAFSLCREAIKQSPTSAAPRIALTTLQLQADQDEAARKTLQEAAVELKDPEEAAQVRLLLAGHLLTKNKREEGLAKLRELAKDRPQDIQSRLALLDQPEVQKNEDEAQDLVDQIKKIEGERGLRWQYEQARVFLRRPDWNVKRPAEVLELLKKVVDGDSGWTAAVILLGEAYRATNKAQQAEDVYSRFVERYPKNLPVASLYLDLLEAKGDYARASQILDRMPEVDALAPHRTRVAVTNRPYPEAIEALKKLITANPKDATSRVMLARLTFQQSGDLKKSLAMLDEAQKIAPELLSVASTRALLLNSAGDEKGAIQALDAEVLRRNDYPAYLLRANFYAAEGKFAEAEKDYQHLPTFPTSKAEGYIQLGAFYERRQQFDKAAAAYEAGSKSSPDNLDLKRGLARSLLNSDKEDLRKRGSELLEDLRKNDPREEDSKLLMIRAEALLSDKTQASHDEAMRLFEKVVLLDPRNIQAHLQLIQNANARGDLSKSLVLTTRARGCIPDSPDLLLVQAGLESDMGNLVAARELVHSVLQQDPGNVPALNLMTQLAIQLGEFAEAAQYNKLALEKAPDQEDARQAQARIAEVKGQPLEAIRLLEQFRATAPGRKSAATALMLAGLYRGQKNYARCEELLKEVEEASPDLHNAFVTRLQMLAEQQKFKEFIELLDARLKLRPDEAQALNSAVTILAEFNATEQMESIKHHFEDFVKKHASNQEGYQAMAMLAYRLGNLEGAQKAYQAALEFDPYNREALNNIAWILTQEHLDDAKALNYANTSISRFPDDPNLLNTRGTILFNLNKLPEAKIDLEKSITLPSVLPGTRARSLIYLAKIARHDSDPARAASLAEQALEIDNKSKVLNPRGGVLNPRERAEVEELIGRPATRTTSG